MWRTVEVDVEDEHLVHQFINGHVLDAADVLVGGIQRKVVVLYSKLAFLVLLKYYLGDFAILVA